MSFRYFAVSFRGFVVSWFRGLQTATSSNLLHDHIITLFCDHIKMCMIVSTALTKVAIAIFETVLKNLLRTADLVTCGRKGRLDWRVVWCRHFAILFCDFASLQTAVR